VTRARGPRGTPWWIWPPAVVGAALVVVPLAALVVRTPWRTLPATLAAPAVRDALVLSFACATVSAVVALLLGVPLAWVQAFGRFRGRSVLRGVTTLPIVLPPVVGGLALLAAFGRRGLVGSGLSLPFTTAAVVLASTFVAMPFCVLTMEAAFRNAGVGLDEAARTLGASPGRVFRTVTLPAVRPALVAAAVLTWARALGEFGATITFAGNVAGVTRTAPLAVFELLEGGDTGPAVAIGVVLVAVAVVVIVSLRDRWLAGLRSAA
jgi:molybdate transport system permease protein